MYEGANLLRGNLARESTAPAAAQEPEPYAGGVARECARQRARLTLEFACSRESMCNEIAIGGCHWGRGKRVRAPHERVRPGIRAL